jgi:hypothetical protein
MNNPIEKTNFNDITDPYYPAVLYSWETSIIEHLPLVSVLVNLTMIQNRILQMNLAVIPNSKLERVKCFYE